MIVAYLRKMQVFKILLPAWKFRIVLHHNRGTRVPGGGAKYSKCQFSPNNETGRSTRFYVHLRRIHPPQQRWQYPSNQEPGLIGYLGPSEPKRPIIL